MAGAKGHDPAATPDRTVGKSGFIEPALTPAAAERKWIEDRRIAREKADLERTNNAPQSVAGHSAERDAEMDKQHQESLANDRATMSRGGGRRR